MSQVEQETIFKSSSGPVQASPELQPAGTELEVKPIHTIILDSSPLLLNTPTLSTLLSQSTALVTTQSVLSEVRDSETRSRIETLYQPFLTVQAPKPESVKFVKEFARKTGDAAVLSGTDIEVLALAFDLECERNGGDWRLRRVPGQKRVNGSKPITAGGGNGANNYDGTSVAHADLQHVTDRLQQVGLQEGMGLNTEPLQGAPSQVLAKENESLPVPEDPVSSGEDSEGWITPSNIKAKKVKESNALSSSRNSQPKTLQVATITGDFAMQNVLLQMNLNLLSSRTCKRITQIKQTILRCHGCFHTTKEMEKQFCPWCGKPTLTRVSCSTNDKGEVKLHLKANMQWNNKGNVFSIPKPVSGRSNQKWTGPGDGGGKSGWGTELVLAEDQKEYVRANTSGARQRGKEKDLMDEENLPNILTGERSANGGRIRIGAGRNVNSRKR